MSDKADRRQGTQTAKGTEYRLDLLKDSYRRHKRSWRTELNSIASLIVTERNPEVLENHCLQLNTKMSSLVEAHEELEKVLEFGEERNAIYEEFDVITNENLGVLKMVKEKLQDLEEKESSASSSISRTSRSSRSSRSSSYKSSNASSTRQGYPRPRKILSSKINSLQSKLEITTERQRIEAEAQAKLEDIERKRLELKLNEDRIKYDLKCSTDRIKTEEDLLSTKAELNSRNKLSQFHISSDRASSSDSLTELPADDYSKELLRRYLNQAKDFTYTDEIDINAEDQFPRHPSFKIPDEPEGSCPRLPSFKFPDKNKDSESRHSGFSDKVEDPYQQLHKTSIPHRSTAANVERRSSHKSSKYQPSSPKSFISDDASPSTRASLVERQLVDIVKTFVDNQHHSSLPSPEPEIFCGDSLQFPTWIQAFEILIEQKTTKPSEKIHYLRKYVSGEAKESIDGLLILNSSDAYELAKEVLVKRFGDPFAVANAYRQKLESWPKIPNGDSKALQKFADFLVHCEKAMTGTTSLAVLDDNLENQRLAAKLPRWLTGRWSRESYQYKEKNGDFPPFKIFVKFVTKESDIANDPVFSPQIPEVQLTRKPKEPSKVYKSASTFSTSTKDSKNDESSSSTITEIKNTQPTCSLCKSSSHEIETCEKFLKKTVDERKKYALNNSLCFGCLNQGHRSKDCQQRKTCEVCKRQHPTPLHGDVKEKSKAVEDAKESVPLATSNCTKISTSRFCKATFSMIVPIWISHIDNPQSQKLIYSLLDDQSTATFITDRVLIDLGVRGVKTRISLSTLHAENIIVDTRKVKNLYVQDFKCQVSFKLPRSFARSSIPVHRSQIPTPEAAELWPHTRRIAKELMPHDENVEVGALIGLNCIRALIPREVVAGDDGSPYALRTDLGWGIVGKCNNNPDDLEDEEEIGVSHTLLSYNEENPPASCHLVCRNVVKEKIDPEQVYKMFNLDFSEANVEGESLSYEEKTFLQRMDDGIVLLPDGHYQIPLPLKDTDQRLPNNRAMALRRLNSLKNRLLYDENYRLLYN